MLSQDALHVLHSRVTNGHFYIVESWFLVIGEFVQTSITQLVVHEMLGDGLTNALVVFLPER